MSFIFCARRPLTVDELCHALAVEEGDSELYEDALPASEILVGSSAGLIRVDNKSKVIGLAHHTLQEYLEKHPAALLPDPDTVVAKACLTYLSFDEFETGPSTDGDVLERRLQVYQLFDYASRYWGYHVRKQTPELVNLVLQYVESEPKLSSSVQFGALHIAAYWGLEKIIDLVLQAGVDINTPDSNGNTALHIAAGRGNYDCVENILQNGEDVNVQNQSGETALHCAAKNNFRGVIELLLGEEALLLADNEGWTALDMVPSTSVKLYVSQHSKGSCCIVLNAALS
ncbi:ankyrin repeat-containing domain protein [Aspergillus ambiguus]|uniref:ankyrin repeat domain-containing protein n=1 Tax=Aspergillus ambiguus TaxID=176160 RepID=UPI003CCCE510